MSENRAVQVLLGTFNGARFLAEQIDSILAQSYTPLTILARDDGSTDETRGILEEYAERFPERFRLLPQSQASGNAKFNFMELLKVAEAPYLAFADQDDLWLPEKIAVAMAAMERLEEAHGKGAPLLVFSDLRVVNDRLETLNPSFWASQHIRPEHIHSLRRLIMQNVVTGCTMLFNQPLRVASLPMPAGVFMHDWWMALVACTLGHSQYLSEPAILYRQHGGNVLGAPTPPPVTGIPKWRQHQERRKYWEMTVRQATALLEALGPKLSAQDRRLLEGYIRCEVSASRLVRTGTLIGNGFFVNGLRSNLALLWYLWDMKRAKQDFPINPV
jgi:hypothetical protein